MFADMLLGKKGTWSRTRTQSVTHCLDKVLWDDQSLPDSCHLTHTRYVIFFIRHQVTVSEDGLLHTTTWFAFLKFRYVQIWYLWVKKQVIFYCFMAVCPDK